MNDKYLEKQVYKVTIAAPIETVWSELIKTASPRPFFWNSKWDARAMRAGEPYRMVSKNGKGVAVIGEILEMEPPRLLVTSFRLTGLDDPASKVTYTLAETEGGTEFCLITENVLAGSKSEGAMSGGAQFIVKNFKAYMETGKVTFGASMTLLMFDMMESMTPKAMRAENWPLDRARQ